MDKREYNVRFDAESGVWIATHDDEYSLSAAQGDSEIEAITKLELVLAEARKIENL